MVSGEWCCGGKCCAVSLYGEFPPGSVGPGVAPSLKMTGVAEANMRPFLAFTSCPILSCPVLSTGQSYELQVVILRRLLAGHLRSTEYGVLPYVLFFIASPGSVLRDPIVCSMYNGRQTYKPDKHHVARHRPIQSSMPSYPKQGIQSSPRN